MLPLQIGKTVLRFNFGTQTLHPSSLTSFQRAVLFIYLHGDNIGGNMDK